MKRNTWIGAAAAALLLLGSTSASALTISMAVASVKNPGNTADATPAGADGRVTTATVTGAGGTDTDAQVGDMLNGAARFFGGAWRSNAGNSNGIVDYRITLTITADPTVIYDVDITHDLEGVIQRASPGLNFTCDGPCNAAISNVTATVVNNGGGTVSGLLTQATAVGGSGTGDTETDILVAPSAFVISGLIGSQTIAIDFSWTYTASMSNNNDCVSARFGVPNAAGHASDDTCAYGDVNSGPGDGHFVTAKTTVTAIVPEPGVALLLGLGLTGLGVAGRRRAA